MRARCAIWESASPRSKAARKLPPMFVEGGLHPEQVKLLRAMTLERRAQLALGFIRSMRRLKAAVLRQQHPAWSEDEIAAELRRIVRNARS